MTTSAKPTLGEAIRKKQVVNCQTAADIIGMHTRTVQRYIADGIIRAERRGRRGIYAIAIEEAQRVRNLLASGGLPT